MGKIINILIFKFDVNKYLLDIIDCNCILEAAPHKTEAVRPPATHHENYQC